VLVSLSKNLGNKSYLQSIWLKWLEAKVKVLDILTLNPLAIIEQDCRTVDSKLNLLEYF